MAESDHTIGHVKVPPVGYLLMWAEEYNKDSPVSSKPQLYSNEVIDKEFCDIQSSLTSFIPLEALIDDSGDRRVMLPINGVR